MHPFFKSKSTFNDFNLNLRPKVYTIVVVYKNYKKEYQGITNPWEYMRIVKQNPTVKTAYIKE